MGDIGVLLAPLSVGVLLIPAAIAWRILNACRHRWERDRVVSVMGRETPNPIAFEHILRCTKCGEMTRRRF